MITRRRTIHRTALSVSAAGALLALGLTACSSGSISGGDTSGESNANQTGATGEDGIHAVSISGPFVPPNAAILLGNEQGIFEKAGLSVEFDEGVSTSNQTPALMAGQTDFALCDPGSTLMAADKGLDIRIIAGFSVTSEESPDHNALVARDADGPKDLSDLVGHDISVDTFQSQGEVMIRESAELNGTDPEELSVNEINFPDMIAQLKAGNTDAVWLPEPFLTIASQDPELRVVGYPFLEVQPATPIEMVCTSGAFAEENPEAVRKMQAAVAELTAYTNENQDQLREAVPRFVEMDPELASVVSLDLYSADIPVEKLKVLQSLMAKFGYVEGAVNVEDIVMHPDTP